MDGFLQHGGEDSQSTKGLVDDLEAWSRVWRSLVFLDGWVSASIGLSSSTSTAVSAPATADLNGYFDGIDTLETRKIDQGLHEKMAKLGILMSAITHQVCAPAAVDMTAVREYNEQLKAWHDNLPESLKLQEALEFRPDSAHRTSILLTHCAYLSSLILLTRRVLIAHSKSILGRHHQHTIYNATEHDIVRFSNDCIYAARQLATVVGIFYMEGRLTRKCWLGIQSAYTSCLIIFLELAYARHQHGSFPQSADMELVSRCICALEYCAEIDDVARAYIKVLVPIRDILFPGWAAGINAGHFQFQQPQPQQSQQLQLHYSQSHRMSLGQRSNSFSQGSSNESHRNSYSLRQASASPNKRPRILAHSSSSGTSSRSDSSHSQPSPPSFSYPYTTTPPSRFPRVPDSTSIDEIFTQKSIGSVSENFPIGAIPATGGEGVNVEYLIAHILDNIEHPYGGDSNVISDDTLYQANDFTTHPYSRFLNPNPPKLPEASYLIQDGVGMPLQFPLYNASTLRPRIEALDYQSQSPTSLENILQFEQPQEATSSLLPQQQPQLQPSSESLAKDCPAPSSFVFAIPAPKKSQQPHRSSHSTRTVRSHTSPMTVSTCSVPMGSLLSTASPQTQYSRGSSRNNSRSNSIVMLLDNTKSVASPGGPLPDIRSAEYEEDSIDGSGGRRRKMPFKSMEEFESFLRRVA